MTVGGLRNAKVLVAVIGTEMPDLGDHFLADSTATIKSLSVKAKVAVNIDSSIVAAPVLGSFSSAGGVQTTGDAKYGLAANTVRSISYKRDARTWKWTSKSTTAPAADGNFEMRIFSLL
jgi:hypothetical protein